MSCTKCVYPLNAVNQIPVLLPCGHTYCIKCLGEEKRQGRSCHKCKKKISRRTPSLKNEDLLILLRVILLFSESATRENK